MNTAHVVQQRRFSSPHGDFSFSIKCPGNSYTAGGWVFVPSRGFLFFYKHYKHDYERRGKVFVPSRGFLFFYALRLFLSTASSRCFRPLTGISLFLWRWQHGGSSWHFRFRPLTGISLFLYTPKEELIEYLTVFVPSRGFLFFYDGEEKSVIYVSKFSSPHGDFSFSIIYNSA